MKKTAGKKGKGRPLAEARSLFAGFPFHHFISS